MRFPSRWPTRRRVICETKTGKTFRGVLWRKSGPLLVLRDVQMLFEGGAVAEVDGEIVIERTNINWLQVLA